MPATRSYEAILKDANEYLEKLDDKWARVQTRRLNGKNEEFRKLMKEQMDLILKVNLKLKKCKVLLINLHRTYGNSFERQKRKEKKKWRIVCRTYNGFLPISVSFNFFVYSLSESSNCTLKN